MRSKIYRMIVIKNEELIPNITLLYWIHAEYKRLRRLRQNVKVFGVNSVDQRRCQANSRCTKQWTTKYHRDLERLTSYTHTCKTKISLFLSVPLPFSHTNTLYILKTLPYTWLYRSRRAHLFYTVLHKSGDWISCSLSVHTIHAL